MLKKFLFLLLSLFICAPCQATEKILILGDSLSAGYGIDIQQGWVALLQQRLRENNLDYEIINASISGDTTSQGLARLPTALNQHRPAIVIIELGGNDGLRGLSLQETGHNLTKIIEKIQSTQSKILLLGVRLPPNYGPTFTEQFHNLYTKLAKKYKVALVPLFLAGIDDQPNLMQEDGLHPNSDAQPKMLKNVWSVLQPML